jgi:uncharacterized protein
MPRSSLLAVPSCFLAVLLLLLAGCASGPAPRQLPEDARQAESLYRDGEFRAAADAWLVAAAGSRSNRDYYRLRAAEAWREEGDLAAAGRVATGISPRQLDDDERQRLLLLQAELALAGGTPRQALERLAQAPRIHSSQRARFHELRGRALEADGQRFAAAAEYAELDPLLRGIDRSENVERIGQLLATLDDAALLAGSRALPSGHPLQPHLPRVFGSRGMTLPDSLRHVPSRPGQPVDREPRYPRVVALLLPQTGPMRLASASVRDGFMTAHYGQELPVGSPRPQVRLYDSGETPEQAVAAYRQAVAEGAEGVVGPLSREAVSALFAEPNLPVPVVGLNRSSGPVPPGSISFALAPEEEAAAIAVRMQQRGLQRVIAVVGGDDNAQRALAGFTVRHLQAGGELLGTVPVPDSGVDYMDAIRRTLLAAGLPTSAPKELATAHHSGFDAVFLALRPTQARLAVPQLRIFGVVEVPTFATSSINSVDDDDRLDRDLNGIEFTEVPWVVADLPGLPSRSALAAQFDSARGPAARLFAFGLDAYRLLAERHRLDYGDLRLDGATGRIEVDPLGEARRQPGIAVFRNQRARLVDAGALLSDGESAR